MAIEQPKAMQWKGTLLLFMAIAKSGSSHKQLT
jgi:hypothetical protein